MPSSLNEQLKTWTARHKLELHCSVLANRVALLISPRQSIFAVLARVHRRFYADSISASKAVSDGRVHDLVLRKESST